MEKPRPLSDKSISFSFSKRKSTLLTVLIVGIFVLSFIALFFIYNHLARTIFRGSDDASILLEAQSMLNGNLFLKGWSLPPDTFWTIDTTVNVICMAIRGFTPSLMYNVPAIVYSLTVIISMIIAVGKRSVHESIVNISIVFIIIAIPSLVLTQYLAHTAFHIGTILLFLLSILIMEKIDIVKLKYLLIFVVMTLANIGDPIALYILTIPMIFVLTLKFYYGGRKKEELFIIITLVIAVVASKIILLMVGHFDGFSFSPLAGPISITSFEDLPKRIVWEIGGILDLFGIDPFNQHLISKQSLEAIIRLPALCLIIVCLFQVIRMTIKKKMKGDLVCQILGVCIVFDLAAFIFSAYPLEKSSSRYLLPVIILGAIIAGRYIYINKNKQYIYLFSVAILGILYSIFFIPNLFAPVPHNATEKMENWLHSNNYTYGYGTYADASIITLNTNNRVKVRPVMTKDGKIIPFNWLSTEEWYRDTSGYFLIYEDSDWTGLNLNTATATFGPPSQTKYIDQYTVLIWDKDITPELKKR